MRVRRFTLREASLSGGYPNEMAWREGVCSFRSGPRRTPFGENAHCRHYRWRRGETLMNQGGRHPTRPEPSTLVLGLVPLDYPSGGTMGLQVLANLQPQLPNIIVRRLATRAD